MEKMKEIKTAKVIQVVKVIEEMIEKKLCEVDEEEYKLYIYPEAQWIGKTKSWKQAFLSNVRAYFDYRMSVKYGEAADSKYLSRLSVYNIETRELITIKNF